MEDSELTRMAVAEIIKEMHLSNPVKTINPVEKKINPLGKPNKRFLNRTLNSIMIYNKREGDRTQKNCRQKIKELDYIQKQRKRKKDLKSCSRRKKNHFRSRSRSKSSRKTYNSSSSDENRLSKKSIRKKIKKKRKSSKKHRKISSSSSSSSSSISSDEARCRRPKKTQHKKYVCDNFFDVEEGDTYEYNLTHANMFNSFGVAAAAYNHINQYLYQQELGNTRESLKLQTEVENFKMTELNDFEQCDIKTENISLLSNEESFSSSVSAWSGDEVNESGVLTIRVSSDEEIVEKKYSKTKSKPRKKNVPDFVISSSSSTAEEAEEEEEEIANVSWNSCISLDSTDAESEGEYENGKCANSIENNIVEILISDEETKIDNTNNNVNCEILPEKVEATSTAIPAMTDAIDLTDD